MSFAWRKYCRCCARKVADMEEASDFATKQHKAAQNRSEFSIQIHPAFDDFDGPLFPWRSQPILPPTPAKPDMLSYNDYNGFAWVLDPRMMRMRLCSCCCDECSYAWVRCGMLFLEHLQPGVISALILTVACLYFTNSLNRSTGQAAHVS